MGWYKHLMVLESKIKMGIIFYKNFLIFDIKFLIFVKNEKKKL